MVGDAGVVGVVGAADDVDACSLVVDDGVVEAEVVEVLGAVVLVETAVLNDVDVPAEAA